MASPADPGVPAASRSFSSRSSGASSPSSSPLFPLPRRRRPFGSNRLTQTNAHSYFTDYAGYKREFSLTDTSIQHTFATKERITFGECIVYAGVIPAVLILLVALIWRRSFWDWHNGWLGLLLSVSLTTVFTQAVKVTVGRPRPDLIDRCQPVADAANRAVYGACSVSLSVALGRAGRA